MSIILRIDGDLSPLNQKIEQGKQSIAATASATSKVEEKVNKLPMQLHMVWAYAMHITNLIVSGLGKVAKTEEEQARLRDISYGLQIAQMGMTIAYTTVRATSFMLSGTPWDIIKGISMYGIAGAMAAQMVLMEDLRRQNKRNDERAEQENMFYEMYR